MTKKREKRSRSVERGTEGIKIEMSGEKEEINRKKSRERRRESDRLT